MLTMRPPRRAAIIRAAAAWVTKTRPLRSMCRPFARSATATRSASSPFRDVTATSAPASARASAIARPMLREPPVTSARFPSKPNSADICACASIRAMATASVEVRISNDARDTAALAAELLTKEAQDFLIRLHRQVEPTRAGLLETRRERWRELREGVALDFLPDSRPLREAKWTVSRVPADLRTRKVEITGPTDRKMVINALNSGASVYMADFEDANTPTWRNLVEGQQNLIDAIERTISFENPDGKKYSLSEKTATLVVRPRGWHLVEKHLRVDGVPIAGALVDFGLYAFHNARRL